MDQEIIAKEREAKSAEELLAMAKENDIELTGEQAKEYYDRLHATGELSDDELDSVSGGCDKIGIGNVCPKCGSRDYYGTGEYHYWTYRGLSMKDQYLQCKDCGTRYR